LWDIFLRKISSLFILRRATEIILQSHNVIFTEVAASLHLDKNQRLTAGVFNPMRRANRDVDRLPCGYDDGAIVESDFGRSLNYHPMFGALRVLLIAQSLPW